MPWHAPGSLFSQCERIWELLSWDNIWRNVFSKYLFKFYFQSQGEWVATWVGKERRTRKVKSLPETGKLKDPVNYFGSDVTHMRPDPWQVQADFNEESLFCQLRIRPDHKHRGRGGPSLALAVDTQPARFGHPLGCPRGVCPVPLFFKKKNLVFFLVLLTNITLTALKTEGFLSATEVPQKWKFSWRCLAERLQPRRCFNTGTCGWSVLVFGHRSAAHAMALSLLVWAFYIGLGHLPGDSGFLFGFFFFLFWWLSHWVGLKLSWISALLQGMTELQALTPGLNWPLCSFLMCVRHIGAFLRCAFVTPIDANGCDMCLSSRE